MRKSIYWIWLYGKDPNTSSELTIHNRICIASVVEVNKGLIDEFVMVTNDAKRLKSSEFGSDAERLGIEILEVSSFYAENYTGGVEVPYLQHQADILRILILDNIYDKISVYCDVDILAVKPFDLDNLKPGLTASIESEDGGISNALIIHKGSGNDILKEWLKNWKTYNPSIALKGSPEWVQWSVTEFERLSKIYPDQIDLKSSEVFMPFYLKYDQMQKLYLSPSELPEECITVHLWDTTMKPVLKYIGERYFLYSNSLYATLARNYYLELTNK